MLVSLNYPEGGDFRLNNTRYMYKVWVESYNKLRILSTTSRSDQDSEEDAGAGEALFAALASVFWRR